VRDSPITSTFVALPVQVTSNLPVVFPSRIPTANTYVAPPLRFTIVSLAPPGEDVRYAVEKTDLEAMLPWLDWAWAEVKTTMSKAA
jgi:hypothetical protein